MDARIATTMSDLLGRLPADGAGRDLALQRLTDMYAAAEASSAVHAAAARARDALRQQDPQGEALANAVSAASALYDLGAPGMPAATLDVAADAARREELSRAIADPAFVAIVPGWIAELRGIAATHPGTGACTVASAMQLWLWTMSHVRSASAGHGTAVSELAQSFYKLIAARAQILEIVNEGTGSTTSAQAHQFYTDLCHVEAARAAGKVAARCAELVFGYRRHPAWDAEGCASCYRADDLDTLEGWIPGIASSARAHSDVIEADGAHAAKAGPCAKADGLEIFLRLRAKLDGCLTGARLAKDRAASALPRVLANATGASFR